MKKYLLSFLFGAVICLGFIITDTKIASADIIITPTRVIFEGRERFASVTLVNPGDKASTYEMKWNYFKMQPTGAAYKRVDGAFDGFDLSKYVVFSPRRVTLEPGASQKIRLALRRPAEIPDGDYIVHFGFAPVPDDVSEIGHSNKPTVAVKIYVGYTIPVILRSGEIKVNAVIDPISLTRNPENGLLKVAVPVKRVGENYSVLGHLMVYHIDKNGNQERVGEISNAHIFPEVDSRLFDVQLIKNITGGSLRIVMYDYLYDKNKSDSNNFIYAEKTFPLE